MASMRQRPEITADILLKAYAFGVFPMADSSTSRELFWMDPDERGILPLDRFHISRRLARTVRSDVFDVRVDTCFGDVIAGCAQSVPGRSTTWINEQITELYTNLYERGAAHSIETWHDGHLVGGLYGVSLGGAFFGESMFSRARDASKVALVHLVGRLIRGGYTLLDTQFTTTHLAQFGAVEVSRAEYRRRLARAVQETSDFHALPVHCPGADLLVLFDTPWVPPT